MGERYRTPTVESGLVCFVIVADAFARNMVRSLVNGCVQVGIGKRSLDWFAGKMAAPLREGSTGPIAPQGLTLEHIEYPADDQLAVRAKPFAPSAHCSFIAIVTARLRALVMSIAETLS